MAGQQCPPEAARQAILEAFVRADPTGDGVIAREHLCRVLEKLDEAFWTDARVGVLISGFSTDPAAGLKYADFLRWLFEGRKAAGEAAAVVGLGSAPSPSASSTSRPERGGTSGPANFTLMTFNVEEYYHGYSSKSGGKPLGLRRCGAAGGNSLKDAVFGTVRGIRQILEEQSPDILCLEEHSLGDSFSEREIMDILLGELGYEYVSEPTGEDRAWYSALANAVVWKGAHFRLKRSWRVELTGKGELVPGGITKYTPRAATCAELEHLASGQCLVVCATHLLGGRFEDSTFLAEASAGRNVRCEQVRKLAESVQATCGNEARSVVAGDFNVMREGYGPGSAFRQGAESYFRSKLLGDALETASSMAELGTEDPFDAVYVPFQTKVHETLSQELGYSMAYGRSDSVSEMKTTHYSGCIDWVYIRNLKSLKDEKVVSAMDKDLSDHNAVMLTLQLD